MKKNLLIMMLPLLFLCGGCVSSTLEWTPAPPGQLSSSGKPVKWNLRAMNNGIYLFYWIPIWCGDSLSPNRFEYQMFAHWINEKHALRLINSRKRQLKCGDAEDVSITYRNSGWLGLGVIWSRSMSIRGVAVEKRKK